MSGGERSSWPVAASLVAGASLRGFRLVEVVGEGAFALVWRAEQPVLGREVAIKQIRAGLANEPEFIRRFDVEAQLVASLEHPFVVPLYDYWREPDAAFLVMRLFRGGTLESLVAQRPLDEGDLRRLVAQVGSALGVAHRAGVVHRDVKPGNVLLDDEASFFLGDFGIASSGGRSEVGVSVGSPAYASPEQLRREPVDARSDIYSFGITLFEAATGRHPFEGVGSHAAVVAAQLSEPVPPPSTLSAGLPGWVDEIVARATAKGAEDRFGSMDELLAAMPAEVVLEAATTGAGPRSAVTLVGAELRNPFKALRAFGEADSGDFYGRDHLVDRFVEVLERPDAEGRLLAVVGPSGSGKSSAVRAGLIPGLRRGAVAGSADWFITTMVPGRRPFEELEAALVRVAEAPPGPLVEVMASAYTGITRAVNLALPDEDAEVVVVVDQFEELFTHTVEAGDRDRFIDGLVAAITEPRSRIRVIVTVRADFWDRPLAHPLLAPLIDAAAVTVTPLAPDELEQVIVSPVLAQGADYEPGLVAKIIADVRDQPGVLPLLQYTLTELFDRQSAGVLTSDAYDDLGGITGALAQRAEHTYTRLDPDQQSAARRLFGRLVTLGEGADDTRRRVPLTELNPDAPTTTCIDAFGDARLLTFDRDPATRDPTIEIAHEALLTAWPRLRDWIDQDREDLRTLHHLTAAAHHWRDTGHDDGDLYRGGRLEAGLEYQDRHPDSVNADERAFLDRSAELREHEQASQIRTNRRLRTLATAVAIVAALALIAGAGAAVQWDRANDRATDAERSAAEADLERLRSESLLLAEQNPDVAVLLAVEAHTIDPSLASKDAIHRILTSEGLLTRNQSRGSGAAAWPSELEERLPLPGSQIAELQEPTAQLHLAARAEGEVLLTSVSTTTATSTVFRHERTQKGWTSTDTGDAALVAGVGDHSLWVADEIVVLGPDERSVGRPIPRPNDLLAFGISRNGQTVVLARDGGLLEVYAADGDRTGRIEVPDVPAPARKAQINISDDGSTFTAIYRDQTGIGGVWALGSTSPPQLEAAGGIGTALDITTGRLQTPFVAGSTIYVNPPQSNDVLKIDPPKTEFAEDRLTGHDSPVTNVVANDTIGLVATTSLDGTVRVWDTATSTQLGREIGALTTQVALDDRNRLIVAHPDRISIWNYDTSTWADTACDAALRNLTREEWDHLGPRGVDFRKTCEQYPLTS